MTQPPSLICSQSVFDCTPAAGPGGVAACAKLGAVRRRKPPAMAQASRRGALFVSLGRWSGVKSVFHFGNFCNSVSAVFACSDFGYPAVRSLSDRFARSNLPNRGKHAHYREARAASRVFLPHKKPAHAGRRGRRRPTACARSVSPLYTQASASTSALALSLITTSQSCSALSHSFLRTRPETSCSCAARAVSGSVVLFRISSPSLRPLCRAAFRESGNFEQRGGSPPVARDVVKGRVVFDDRLDVGERLFRLALGEQIRAARLRAVRGNRFSRLASLITDFAAAPAHLDLAHHHVVGTADAVGLDRLAGLENDVLRRRRRRQEQSEEARES